MVQSQGETREPKAQPSILYLMLCSQGRLWVRRPREVTWHRVSDVGTEDDVWFRELVDFLYEGGASAEQIADSRSSAVAAVATMETAPSSDYLADLEDPCDEEDDDDNWPG